MRRRTFCKTSAIAAISAVTAVSLGSCSPSSSDSASSNSGSKAPLKVGLVPWIGWGEAHIADEKGFYTAEGIEVEHVLFQSVTDVNTALLSDQIDLVWLVANDLIVLSDTKPGLKFIYASDYSGEVDSIVGRNIDQPSDIAGKTLAREEIPYEIVFVAKFLESVGLTDDDVNVVPLTAADGSTALVAENVDAVATYEPFVTNALESSDDNKILFSAAGTNIIINGLAAPESVLSDRREDVLAYLRAVEKGNQFRESNPEEANQIAGDWIGLSGEEAAGLMNKIDKMDVSSNKTIGFGADKALSVAGSIDSAGPILVEAGLVETAVSGSDLVDSSFIEAL